MVHLKRASGERGRPRTARRRARAAVTLAAALAATATACAPFTLSLSVPATSAPAEVPDPAPQPSSAAEPEATAPAAPKRATDACADGSTPREMRFTDASPNGRWGGTIREHGGKSYRLEATVEDRGCEVTGTFTYVELGCSGTWSAPAAEDVSEPQPGPRGIRARITETVTRDPDQACASTAQVQLVYGPAGMLYASGWDMPDGSDMESRAQLEPLP